ncbi:hypothetical protein [Streptomyces sp. NRRL B-24484]|uniref:hypothetical protein n=1 Tax=Streptomyces sp. NRRL B-24484 TaxID=1463833 RepID=UPI0004C2A993|nr:hypothetical protein [Streptomyces sp. NRRL B-24484]
MKKATEMRRTLRRALLTGAAACALLLGAAGTSAADIPIESWNNTGASAGDGSTGSPAHTAGVPSREIHIASWNSTGADYHRPPTVS